MSGTMLAVAILVAGSPAAGQAQEGAGDPVPAVSMMGLAEMQACGTLALAIEADREAARRRNAQLSAGTKAISAEDKAIAASRKTIDLHNAAAVAAFNRRMLAQSQMIAAYNREVATQRTPINAANARSDEFNVKCASRPYDQALLAQLPAAVSKAMAAISSQTLIPNTVEPDPGAIAGGTSAPVVDLAGAISLNTAPVIDSTPIPALQKAAIAGDTEAQFRIGMAYLDGRQVGRDPEQAIGWLEKAAAANHAKALFALSLIYSDGTVAADEKRSLAYLTRAAEAGLADAQHNLGLWYAEDHHGRTDLPLAISWMTKAATAGDPESQYVLAEMLQRNAGGRTDAAEALAWMRRGADQGFRPAQKAMGERYWRGKDVAEDKVEALKWYLLAAGMTKVDAAKSCLRLTMESRDVREAARAAADAARQAMTADAIALATRRADDWIVSFKATKVGGC